MAESSSESDSYLRTRGYRSRGRDTQPRDRRGRAGADADLSAKIDTLANTLQVSALNVWNIEPASRVKSESYEF